MSEIDLIRRLVETLQSLQDRDTVNFHDVRGYYSDPDEKCGCVLCTARQYLEWREPPKVEDPASDQVEFAKVMS